MPPAPAFYTQDQLLEAWITLESGDQVFVKNIVAYVQRDRKARLHVWNPAKEIYEIITVQFSEITSLRH